MVDLGVVGNPARLDSTAIQQSFLCSAIAKFASTSKGLAEVLRRPGWIVALVRGWQAPHPLKLALCWAWLWESDTVESALTAFGLAIEGGYEPTDAVQKDLWPGEDDASADLAMCKVREAMQSVQTLEELARRMHITGGVLRSWMTNHSVLRSAWKERKETLRLKHTVEVLTAEVKSRRWSGRAEFVHRYDSLVAFLANRDADGLEEILSQIPTHRSKQRRLF